MARFTDRHLKKSRVRHDARTIPLKGRGADDGKWFRCWNCGFICNVDRDSLGGPESRSGVSSEFYYEQYPQSTGLDRSVMTTTGLNEEGEASDGTALALKCRVVGHSRTLALGPDGTGIEPKLTYAPLVTGGCPLCGCRNWRGDYR